MSGPQGVCRGWAAGLLLALSSPAYAQPIHSQPTPARAPVALEVPWVPQTRAPWCAAAAALSAANAQGAGLALRPFVAQLTVHADGIAWIDVADALAARGFEVAVFHGSIEAVRQAVARHLPPVLSLRRGAGRHAVVVTGLDGAALRVVDPAAGPARVEAAEVARWVAAGAPMVVVARAPAALPAAWREGHLDFRAEALARKARGAPESAGALAFLDAALQARPGWAELHHDRAVHLARLGQGAAACAALRTARGLLVHVPVGPMGVAGGRPGRVAVAGALDRAGAALHCGQ